MPRWRQRTSRWNSRVLRQRWKGLINATRPSTAIRLGCLFAAVVNVVFLCFSGCCCCCCCLCASEKGSRESRGAWGQRSLFHVPNAAISTAASHLYCTYTFECIQNSLCKYLWTVYCETELMPYWGRCELSFDSQRLMTLADVFSLHLWIFLCKNNQLLALKTVNW